jgi:peptidoglycan-N-acetylglucosamine deacetylase
VIRSRSRRPKLDLLTGAGSASVRFVFLAGLILSLGIVAFPRSCGAEAGAAPPSLQPPSPPSVAITIDDIPDHGDLTEGVTPRDISVEVIKALRQNGVTNAYGFTNGTFMEEDPRELEILKLWLNAGYPLGNHTFHHPDLTKTSARTFIADIARQDRLLRTLTSSSPLIAERLRFRYPYLNEGNTLQKRDTVRAYLIKHGYRRGND